MKNSFLAIFSLILLVSCDKYTEGDFSGVLVNDFQGVIWGMLGEDDGDWETDDEFNSIEEALFRRTFELNTNLISDFVCNEDTALNSSIWAITPIGVYPTLSTGKLNVYSSYDNAPTVFKMIIVNKDYDALFEIEHHSENRGSISFQVDLEEAGIIQDEIHRVYYMIVVEDASEYRGHGDFIYTKDTGAYF